MNQKYTNKYLIETGIGLQDVDNLRNSTYFIKESERYIKGEISLAELDHLVSSYYKEKDESEDRTKEADIVSTRIASLVEDDSFTFSVGQLLSIHKFLFDGLIESAGKLRSYNFSKKEWVLDGNSVTYGDYRELEMTLDYDLSKERVFNYSKLSIDDVIEHLSFFIANLWQIHVFEEGNTRTAAVFFIKYLRSLGFDVTNDTFAKNAWYFRNALVRANYRDVTKGIYEDRHYLVKFLRNLLLGEDNTLSNKELHISSGSQVDTSKEVRVLSLIKNKPNIKVEELADQLKVSTRTVKSLLAELQKEGKLERVNGKKYGYWRIINN